MASRRTSKAKLNCREKSTSNVANRQQILYSLTLRNIIKPTEHLLNRTETN